MGWTREEILVATGGRVVRQGKDSVFGDVVTDSQGAKSRSVFVALKGGRVDGHQFLDDALRHGASCLVVHKRVGGPRVNREDMTVIKVADTLKALGDLAQYRRQRVAPMVLAITGSNGKTTTKEMVASICQFATIQGTRLRGKVLKTEGNYNNLVGLPLTLLRLSGREKVAVVELGTSEPGEIRRLTEIAKPDMGIITSVAPAHLTGLNTITGVAREKGEIFRRMSPRGVAVVNMDDPWTRRLGKAFKGGKITYGTSGEVRGERLQTLGEKGMEFTLRAGGGKRRVRLRLPGAHNVSNAVGAAAMAYGLGADLEAMSKGLEAVRPMPMRMAIERVKGVGIINDAYNANPASMDAALRALAGINCKGDRVAVLGDMLELGRESAKRHYELGQTIARCHVDRVYLLGPFASHVREGAFQGGMDSERVTIGKNYKTLAMMIRKHTKRGDWILFKGSRGIGMEKVLASFRTLGD